MRHATLVAIAGLVLTATHAAKASVIFSDTSAGYLTANPYGAPGGNSPIGFEFTASQTAVLQSIDLFLVDTSNAHYNVSDYINLFSDVNNSPNTLLGSWAGFTSYMTNNSPFEQTINGISGLTLTQGTTYFLEYSDNFQRFGIDWLQNAAGVQTSGYYTSNTWYPGTINNADFDVLGTPVAEPGTLALLGTGLLCMGGLLRRSRTNAAAA
jgi:hypothetical protein